MSAVSKIPRTSSFLFHMAAGHTDAVAFFQEIPILGREFFKGRPERHLHLGIINNSCKIPIPAGPTFFGFSTLVIFIKKRLSVTQCSCLPDIQGCCFQTAFVTPCKFFPGIGIVVVYICCTADILGYDAIWKKRGER